MSYNFSIQYKSRCSNTAADSLSRIPEKPVLSLLTAPIIHDFEELKEMLAAVSFLANILSSIQHNSTAHPKFSIKGAHLYYNNRLAIPVVSPYVPLYYENFIIVQWEVMRASDAPTVCKSLWNFLRNKHDTSSPAGWDDITMDFIEGLPKSKGYSSILVVVDRLTKYAHFVALKHPFTAVSIAKLFIQEVVRLHGIPRSIISDRDPIFMSLFWCELFYPQGFELWWSSVYHPQTDGQTEVVNWELEMYLPCFASNKPTSWIC